MTTKKTKELVTRFLFCLDSSGSMFSIKEAAVNAFNKNVTAIRDGAIKAGQSATVSLITFGERSSVVEKFFNANVETLTPLPMSDYRPDGNTPMLDAVGLGIEKFEALNDEENVSYMIFVVTDGAENSSTKYTASKLAKLMKKVNDTDRWTFAFLVPPGEKKMLCSRFSIPEGNVREWETTAKGLATATNTASAEYDHYYATRASGQSATRSFFTTDLSEVKTKDVKKVLANIKDSVHVWQVPDQTEIKQFVEDKGVTYSKGKAFYQLTKDEVIQRSKNIILVEKGKTAVYAGADARDLLGLPDYDVKVHPGNHSNWDIFVQSTSTNRKLVRGSKLVYMK